MIHLILSNLALRLKPILIGVACDVTPSFVQFIGPRGDLRRALYSVRLARAPVTVAIVDKHNYHLVRTMLYQVATALLSSDELAAPIRSTLRRQKDVTFS